ncbi:MAG: hypothetical protein AAFV46_07570, partial [Cyanobacteria bacterium J06635_11]
MTANIRPPHPSDSSDDALNANGLSHPNSAGDADVDALTGNGVTGEAAGSSAEGMNGQQNGEEASAPLSGNSSASTHPAVVGPSAKSSPEEGLYRGAKFDVAAASKSSAGPSNGDERVYRGIRYAADGERYAPEKIEVTEASRSRGLQWFHDLPVSDKQLSGLLASKILSVLGVIGVSLLLLSMMGRRQLVEQAVSELSATANDLDNERPAAVLGEDSLVEAAQDYAENGQAGGASVQAAQRSLRGELNAMQLEYVTLLGTDMRVIASGGSDRTGDLFNPDNLVSSALRQGTPKQATVLLSVAELNQLGVITPPNADEAALLKYSVTPLFSGGAQANDAVSRGEVVGALVTGDVVSSESAEIANALSQFSSGYSAL